MQPTQPPSSPDTTTPPAERIARGASAGERVTEEAENNRADGDSVTGPAADAAAREKLLRQLKLLVDRAKKRGVPPKVSTGDELVQQAAALGVPLPEEIELTHVLDVTDRSLHEVTDDAERALLYHNRKEGTRDDRELYVRGNQLTRAIADTGTGFARLEPITKGALKEQLSRSAHWIRQQGAKEKRTTVTIYPPNDVVAALLERRHYPGFPPLERVVTVPVLDRDGRLDARPGYNASAEVFYDEPVALRDLRARVAVEDPLVMLKSVRDEDVAWALDLLLNELLGDFPFVDQASRANALGLLLTPFLKSMISGPIPLGLFDAPDNGTGKTTCAQAVLLPAFGVVADQAPLESDAEYRKNLTTAVRFATPVILWDNLVGKVDSSALATFLTSEIWRDRQLGGNEHVVGPASTMLVGTANQAELSRELARRSVRVSLDTRQERPTEGRAFRHPDLLGWGVERRSDLILAALTLIRAWLSQGVDPDTGEFDQNALPQGPAESSDHPEWTRIVGGVLANTGVGGFLANRRQFWEEVDPEQAEWREFVAEWHALGLEPLHADELVGQIYVTNLRHALPLTLKAARHDQLTQRLGTELGLRKNRVFGGLVIRKVGARRWTVVPNDAQEAGQIGEQG